MYMYIYVYMYMYMCIYIYINITHAYKYINTHTLSHTQAKTQFCTFSHRSINRINARAQLDELQHLCVCVFVCVCV